MRTKKILALAMATMMTLSSTVIAFAADATAEAGATDTIEGEGKLEGYAEKSIFTVSVPTDATVGFVIDPQELLLATKGKTNGLTAFTIDGSDAATSYGSKVLFGSVSADGKTGTFTSKSENIDFVNKSSFDVDVNITATVDGLADTTNGTYNVALLDKDTAFGTETEMKLTLTPTTSKSVNGTIATEGATEGTATYLQAGETGVTMTTKVEAAPDTAFEFAKDDDGTYSYALTTDPDTLAATEFKSVSYNLAGTVNTAADWKAFNAAGGTMGVSLAYSVKKHVDKSLPTFSTGSDIGTISYTKGTGTDALSLIESVVMTNELGPFDGYGAYTNGWSKATDTGNLITFDEDYVSYYDDKETYEATITYLIVGEEGDTDAQRRRTATVTVKTSEATGD